MSVVILRVIDQGLSKTLDNRIFRREVLGPTESLPFSNDVSHPWSLEESFKINSVLASDALFPFLERFR